jgi:hypothetical protein
MEITGLFRIGMAKVKAVTIRLLPIIEAIIWVAHSPGTTTI